MEALAELMKLVALPPPAGSTLTQEELAQFFAAKEPGEVKCAGAPLCCGDKDCPTNPCPAAVAERGAYWDMPRGGVKEAGPYLTLPAGYLAGLELAAKESAAYQRKGLDLLLEWAAEFGKIFCIDCGRWVDEGDVTRVFDEEEGTDIQMCDDCWMDDESG